MAVRRFVGIGINEYQDSPLNGCIPDIMLAYQCSKEKFGFTDFKLLDNKNATKKNILRVLIDSITGLSPGDHIYIHYSGHGSYQPCRNLTASSETDNYDEGWVPYDYDYAGLLIDNDLNNILCNLDPRIRVTVVSDSCFSGTMMRSNPGSKWKNRFVPPPLQLILESGDLDLDQQLAPKISRQNTGKTQLKPFLIETGSKQNNVVLITGCGEHQTSADIFVPELRRYHGAMSYNLFKTLSGVGWKITHTDLVTKTNQLLRNNEYEQVSQLECKSELMSLVFLS